MEMEIVVSNWSMLIDEDSKQKTIGGKYQVKMSGNVVSESNFNTGYSSTKISIPASILAELEEVDEKIKDAIVKNFTT